jgi:hypothetical protein
MSGHLLLRPGEPGDATLWSIDARGRPRPTDPDEIGLSDELADRIEEWVDLLDAAFDDEAPGGHVFADDTARKACVAECHGIADAIRAELGSDWTVDCDLSGLDAVNP